MTSKTFFDYASKIGLAVSIIVLYFLHFEHEQAIVYVDSQKLVAGYKGMQAARKEFEAKASVWKANMDTLQVDLENKMKEYELKQATLSKREKELTEELIQSKQEQYLNYQTAIQEKIQQEDQALSKAVLEKVNDYLKRYGKYKGYKIILAATQYGNIAYAHEGKDVTEEVIKGLNEEYR
jgi:outer membrane protein